LYKSNIESGVFKCNYGKLRRMATKKATKTHTSSRKKASAPSATKRTTKKASAKASKRPKKFPPKPKITKAEWLELRELTLKMFQMVYDSYQRGEFHRIF